MHFTIFLPGERVERKQNESQRDTILTYPSIPPLHFPLKRAVAEFSAIITDLPEVIGIGIAFNVFFGIPYYAGVLISPVTTLIFLATQEIGGMRYLEAVIILLVGVMSIALWVEMGIYGCDGQALIEGWVFGFAKVSLARREWSRYAFTKLHLLCDQHI